MSRTAMRRLRAANPVPHLSAPTPIDTVLSGWAVDLGGAPSEPPGAPSLDEARRRSRTRPSSTTRVRGAIPAVVGVAVVIAVAIVALSALHAAKHPNGIASRPTSGRTYTDKQGWSISYPSAFSLVTQGHKGGPLDEQVTLASFSAPRTLTGRLTHDAATNLFRLPYTLPLDASGRFPADGVALILQPSSGLVLGSDSAFPVALSQFARPQAEQFFSKADDRRAAIPPARTHEVVAYGEEVTAVVLIGAKASQTLRAELATTIASLSFPHLAPGTQVGDAVVLGPASRYPLGSFTLIHARFTGGRDQPIYLVHAPGRLTYGHDCQSYGPCTPAGAFYGIGPEYNTRSTNAPVCQLGLDRQKDEFYCNNLGVKWDRVGRVIARPANESYIGSIEGLYAKIAWDGQIMIMPGFGPQLSRAAVHELWPGWRQPNEPLSR
jgi:hypothetical protein